ncbi:nucleotidyltransferase domain-containing protein [Nocardioides sp. S-58]|uniref:Nucleotidyltransferase domain-containing protein n=1 Tax=Nocardioides renjunii TaxID=3095075 RepID=A0ABU5KBJ7_9ACTN|nr:nucleotidyltransferase domain-containing protein [Nocardioides sp. S-58]MDZ5662352.1 nucleotidyltransferase domain-containing protein [Nocardioides sp. S-58]
MASPSALKKRAQARAASRLLAGLPGVNSVALFGSVARGDADPSSDIDLIVLGMTDELTSSELRRQVSLALSGAAISVSYYTPASLQAYLGQWSRFGAHLRLESTILHDKDGELRKILAVERPITTEYEFAAQARHLDRYKHVDRFGGRFLFPLAHLYRIGRAATFAAIAKTGRLEFDRRKAFDIASILYPDLEREFASVAALAPFYEYQREPQSRADSLPYDPSGPDAEQHFVAARDAVARVVSVGVVE